MKKIIIWGFLLLNLLFVILPLFKPYISGTADGLGHRFRLVSFYNSLKEGNIRPRWAKEAALGYGAPTFLFNYPLPYYLGSLFLFLGFSVDQAGQILSALSLFLSGLFMFLLGRKLFGNWGGIVAAILYTYTPYHLQMTYLYDAWGEELAFVFPPLILYLLKVKKNALLLTICWFLFILSHNVSVLMFTPVLLLLGFVIGPNDPPAGGQPRLGLLGLNAFLLAVVLSAFFWLPAVVLQNEMKYPMFLMTEGAIRGSFFKSFSFQTETAFRVIRDGITHYLDFTVGLPILLIGLIACLPARQGLIRLIRNSRKSFDHWSASWRIGLLVLLSFSLYLTNYLSSWLWSIPPFTYILYPFRFLFVTSFAGALLGGVIAKRSKTFAVVIIILTLIQGKPYLNPYTDIFPFPNTYFYQKQTVTAAPGTKKNMLIAEFLPKLADMDFLVKSKGETVNQEKVKINYSGAERLSFDVKNEKEDELTINRFYFPNWKVYVDGRQAKINMDNVGRILVRLQPGTHSLKLIFAVSKIEQIANLISLGAVIFLFLKRFLWK